MIFSSTTFKKSDLTFDGQRALSILYDFKSLESKITATKK